MSLPLAARSSLTGLLASVSLAGCQHSAAAAARTASVLPPPPSTAAPFDPAGCKARGTVTEYLAQLPPPGIVVGFDVDDTVLFSTPSFLLGQASILPPVPSEEGSPQEQLERWRKWRLDLPAEQAKLFLMFVSKPRSKVPELLQSQYDAFWDVVNGEGDRDSPPKVSVRRIVQAHLARGDEVVFITARASGTHEQLTARLRDEFGERIRVVFTGNEPKKKPIEENHVAIYYGDGDRDMSEASGAARTVRVLRTRYSSNHDAPHPCTKDESFVITDSDL